jgi:mRNA-degrading endonuclease RelE of RelBE toxin-antitoxin system
MAYKLDFHPEAETEFEEALLWYQSQREGLEEEFYSEYLVLEKRIEESPYQFPAILENIRKANLSRFPYSIFFSIEDKTVFIYAVFHQKRNPDVWMERL